MNNQGRVKAYCTEASWALSEVLVTHFTPEDWRCTVPPCNAHSTMKKVKEQKEIYGGFLTAEHCDKRDEVDDT